MGFIFEIILELIFEGAGEICSNKKISKWIRYPILCILILFIMAVIFGIIFLGIMFFKTNIYASLLFITIGIILLIASIVKIRKAYKEKR